MAAVGAPSKGTDSAIVLRVVRNRARVYRNENWNGEGEVRGAMWILHRFTADCALHAMRCRLRASLQSRRHHHSCRRMDSLFAPTPLGYPGALEVLENAGSCLAPPGRLQWVSGVTFRAAMATGVCITVHPCMSNANGAYGACARSFKLPRTQSVPTHPDDSDPAPPPNPEYHSLGYGCLLLELAWAFTSAVT